MVERVPCEFFLIRYVPDVVKGEFTNIGVVLREAGRSGGDARAQVQSQVRFTRDWARVRCMDADADTALLEGLEQELALRLADSAVEQAQGLKPLIELLGESLSNAVQISGARACLAESLPAELEQLMRMYVEPLKVKAARKPERGRAALVATMRTEFERAGVWGLMRRRIAAATYTRAGDPMRLDCGYRTRAQAGDEARGVAGDGARDGAGNGTLVRIFQAVSLEGEVDGARGLAWAAAQLRDGVRRMEDAGLELTAVVEPLRAVAAAGAIEDEGEAYERYRFGVEAMESAAIRVLTANDLGPCSGDGTTRAAGLKKARAPALKKARAPGLKKTKD